MTIEAMKQALEALEMLARYENPETRIQVRKPKDGGPIVTMYPHKVATDAGVALRTAIEQAEKQEPVALEAVYETIIHWDEGGGKRSRRELARRIVDLYTTPPAAQRQPLTDAEVLHLWAGDTPRPVLGKNKVLAFARAIEAAHGIKEKNT